MRQRIQTLDGLRFLAALGVLWIHSWTYHGNPRFYIGKLDIADILAIGGNGVDLFFVISGFCMYYFYASKSGFTYQDFSKFIVKRWARLSPAFYVSTILYIFVFKYVYHYRIDPLLSFVHSLFYFNYILSQYTTASPFWTLTVEWQFYFTIPFLLIYQNKIGFRKTFALIFGLLFIIAVVSVCIFRDQSDLITNSILFRGVEFGCGIIAARVFLTKIIVLNYRAIWLIASIIILYIGRIAVSKVILNSFPVYYNLVKLPGFIIMAIGFAGILYLSLTSAKWLNAILGNKLFKTFGRISYSFYLLHALIQPPVADWVIQYLPFIKGMMAPVATTVICTVILYPVALLSFNLLEKPFLSIGNLTTR